ncbi:uncharacterized protein YpuA (DUF1002 family) [Melghirimyces profundicolus]|uniref:Uncharacterized protein YpuA (DUF1002 family) n=1 Tax=Melghirimyces profundicolus TaxID=1242148 RepID=A0A2T6BTN2_9BACL|nr:DUF1002 domain-containing protein [Melghirimyces profundicolus]PTX59337.1 uncharacterized protein YpuA (DUF1002 family) [Melghirimyces profundicolus]
MKKKNKSLWALIGLFLFAVAVPSTAFADAVTGETVVTLGQDLTPQQKEQILQEMNVDNNVKQITVTNEEEHRYLGQYLDEATIGSRALSSAKITLTEKGSGIQVETNNISTITDQMYANALVTAGVKDAEVYVTAPMEVSGTAGLTGILKAFEAAAGKNITEEQKQVANEEMVRTSELGQSIGDKEKAVEFMNRVKDEIAQEQPQSAKEVRDIIVNVAGDMNINLNDQDIERITNLMVKFSELNIDWDSLSSQLDQLKRNLDQVVNSEEAKSFLDKLFTWLAELIDSLKKAFSS